jgi:hypothetical protein
MKRKTSKSPEVHVPRYQDFVDEQRRGIVHGLFIDESGSPGLANTPMHLHPDRKSWVAVLVPRTVIAEVWRELPRALAELEQLTGAKEFHFADVYAGRGAFRGVDLQKRLGVFGFMAEIFGTYNFPVFVQTLDPAALNAIQLGTRQFPTRLGPFDFSKHDHLAFFFLLLRVRSHLERRYSEAETPTRVFVDEGLLKNGSAVQISPFAPLFADGLICFGRSDSILPLQLADFAAFCLNRTQLLLGKPELSEIDMQFLRLISPLAWNYQYIPVVSAGGWFGGGSH